MIKFFLTGLLALYVFAATAQPLSISTDGGVGSTALYNHIKNNYNTAVEACAMENDTSGVSRVATGVSAMRNNRNGVNNAAAGESAPYNESAGLGNTAVGSRTLLSVTAGTNNTASVAEANVNSGVKSNAAVINARAYVSQNNSLILGRINGATANTSAGIGTTAPAARLYVEANCKPGANGAKLNEINKSTETCDIPSLARGAMDIQTFTLPNAQLGLAVNFSSLFAPPNGITISYTRVLAAGVVKVKVINAGNATQNPASMSFYVGIIR